MVVMAVLVASELVALTMSVKLFSAVSAFIKEDGAWSRAQENASFFLIRYTEPRSREQIF